MNEFQQPDYLLNMSHGYGPPPSRKKRTLVIFAVVVFAIVFLVAGVTFGLSQLTAGDAPSGPAGASGRSISLPSTAGGLSRVKKLDTGLVGLSKKLKSSDVDILDTRAASYRDGTADIGFLGVTFRDRIDPETVLKLDKQGADATTTFTVVDPGDQGGTMGCLGMAHVGHMKPEIYNCLWVDDGTCGEIFPMHGGVLHRSDKQVSALLTKMRADIER